MGGINRHHHVGLCRGEVHQNTYQGHQSQVLMASVTTLMQKPPCNSNMAIAGNRHARTTTHRERRVERGISACYRATDDPYCPKRTSRSHPKRCLMHLSTRLA